MRRTGTAVAMMAASVLAAAASAGTGQGGASQPATQPAKSSAPTVARLQQMIRTLAPLHTRLGRPGPNDWLAHHKEPGQTFAQYLQCQPTLPRGKRTVLYIQPLGDFTDSQRKVVDLAGQFLGVFYNLPVKRQPPIPLSAIPSRARRVHPAWGDPQILTTYVLEELLLPKLPQDAAVCIALTATDLWPGEGWNFVFGQASLQERVGVWSIYRYGNPGRSDESFRTCLLRAMKVAVHETGHMFSLQHCIAYECGMCGSNSLPEADRRPLAFCPECAAKVCWATRMDPVDWLKRLEDLCRAAGLDEQAAAYEKLRKAVE